jgi:hypothetical protein
MARMMPRTTRANLMHVKNRSIPIADNAVCQSVHSDEYGWPREFDVSQHFAVGSIAN